MIETLPIDDAQIYDEIVRRIVQTADPDKVIVFGSRARGDHRPDSDVDILVVAESDEPRYARRVDLQRAGQPTCRGGCPGLYSTRGPRVEPSAAGVRHNCHARGNSAI